MPQAIAALATPPGSPTGSENAPRRLRLDERRPQKIEVAFVAQTMPFNESPTVQKWKPNRAAREAEIEAAKTKSLVERECHA